MHVEVIYFVIDSTWASRINGYIVFCTISAEFTRLTSFFSHCRRNTDTLPDARDQRTKSKLQVERLRQKKLKINSFSRQNYSNSFLGL